MLEPRSFERDSSRTVTGPRGQVGHEEHLAHSDRLVRALHHVGTDAWCLVGNGLSNQTFVRGPEGIIAIDSGESVEEMRAAIAALRTVTREPIVAVLYTHFHYVQGTRAVIDERGGADLPIWGHTRLEGNLLRAATEVAPAYARGLIEQFALQLPLDGPDGLVNVGLGLAYRLGEHAPFTLGHVPPTETFDGPTVIRVAGLDVHVQPRGPQHRLAGAVQHLRHSRRGVSRPAGAAARAGPSAFARGAPPDRHTWPADAWRR